MTILTNSVTAYTNAREWKMSYYDKNVATPPAESKVNCEPLIACSLSCFFVQVHVWYKGSLFCFTYLNCQNKTIQMLMSYQLTTVAETNKQQNDWWTDIL